MSVDTIATADDVREALAGKPTKAAKKEKVAKEPREKKEVVKASRTPLADDLVLHYGADSKGVAYSPENMPCHEGTKRYVRFARFVDGMTVAEAAEVELPNGQIRQYIARGWVVASGETADTQDVGDEGEAETTEDDAA